MQVVAGSNPVAPTSQKAVDSAGLPADSTAFDFMTPGPRPTGAPSENGSASELDSAEDAEPPLALPQATADLFIAAGAALATRAAGDSASRTAIEGILHRAAEQAGHLIRTEVA